MKHRAFWRWNIPKNLQFDGVFYRELRVLGLPEMLSMDIHGARPFQLTEVMIFQVERRSTNSEKLETWEFYT